MRYLLSEIAAVSGGRLVGPDRAVSRVTVDSRTFFAEGEAEGVLFVAIRGASRDGAAYVAELYDRGVRAFVVGEDFAEAFSGGSEGVGARFPEAGFVVMNDTITALQALAAHYRGTFRGKVVGITGSAGKTTVKEWIAQLTPAGVSVFRSPKSYNSQIGVPLAVLMAAAGEDYVVIEAGISQPGEMAALQQVIRPDRGILTVVGGAHAENFASLEELRAEKMKLFRDTPEVLFGDEGMGFAERGAALAAEFWRSEGWPISDDQLAALEPVAMHLEVKEGVYNSVIINDIHNSDVASLAIALDFLAREAGGRPRTLIMADLSVAGGGASSPKGCSTGGAAGSDATDASEAAYRRVAALVEAAGVDYIRGIGPAMTAHAAIFGGQQSDAAIFDGSSSAGSTAIKSAFYPTVEEFLRALRPIEFEGHAVLVKGGARIGFERIGPALERRTHTTVLRVDLDAIIHNLALCRQKIAAAGEGTKAPKTGAPSKKTGVVAMIKASAYGHGALEVARTLQAQGVDYLAVAFADEGVALREEGITMPIVVLNADADSFEAMIRHRLEPEIYNSVSLSEFTTLLRRHGEQNYPIHIKLDTGMHRLGFGEKDIPRLVEKLAAEERWARVMTIFSHLAAADDPAQDAFTRCQIADFDRMSSAIARTLPHPPKRHLANTSGVERFPEARFDMVRLGIGLYGFGMRGARPAASLVTRIVNITPLEAGETVGYNRRGVLTRPSLIATIPIGYADGLNRRLSVGAWSMRVNGQPAPIVGNVCMDSCMIDVTDIQGVREGDLSGVREGDEAVIFSPIAGNTVEDMAAVLGTIPYEVMTAISGRVKRLYTKE